jgi:hypothetical protein
MATRWGASRYLSSTLCCKPDYSRIPRGIPPLEASQDGGSVPSESPRYGGWADAKHHGLREGPAELLPLIQAAAQDAIRPLSYHGRDLLQNHSQVHLLSGRKVQ